MFATGLLSAIAIKLTSSVDDVLWLAPFLTSNVGSAVRLQNALVYIGVCLVQTAVAMVIASSGDAAISWLTANDKNAWSTNKILTLLAGSLLAMYTVKLTHEYFTEEGDDAEKDGDDGMTTDGGGFTTDGECNDQSEYASDDESTVASEMELGLVEDRSSMLLEKKGYEGPVKVTVPGFMPLQTLPEDDQQNEMQRSTGAADKSQSADKKRQSALFVIAFIGSIDDLTLFVPMLVGKGFDWLQLVIGAVTAASTIVMICLFISLCKPVSDFLASIPLALIVAVFSTTLLIKGGTMA